MAVVRTLVRDTLLLHQTCLPANLRGDFVVRKTGGGEDGNLLATSNGVHGVNGRYTGGDHLLRIDLVYVSTDLLLIWECGRTRE